MGLSRIRQDHLWTEGSGITDTLNPTDHDVNAVTLKDTVDYVCSQLADMLGETAWETAPDLSIATMAARTWLSDVRRVRSRLYIHDITIPSEAKAAGTLTTVTGANLLDTDNFILEDGTNAAVTFQFDSDSSVIETNVLRRVSYTSGDSADTVRDSIISAVNTAPVFAMTASSGGSGLVNLQNDVNGAFGNIDIIENVANAGFVATGMSAGAGDMVVLSVAGSDVPAGRNISLSTSTSGLVAAKLAYPVGRASLTEVAGDNSLTPSNINMIINGANGDPVTSAARRVYALMQADSTSSDGATPDDTTNQLQLTFVRPNTTYDDLEIVPSADLVGLSICYAYADREYLHLWSQDDFRRDVVLVDLSASAISVTMDTAYDGGSLVNVDNTNVDFRVTDTKHFYVSDSTGSDKLIDAAPAAGGDVLNFKAAGGVNIVGNVAGTTYTATWNGVAVGSAAGTVSTASGDLTLSGADDVNFVTTRQTSLPLDDATAGPISALPGGPFASVAAAIKYAIQHGTFTFGVTTLASNYARDVNIPAGAGSLNINTPHSIDMNTAGVDTLIFWNGRLAYGGNGTTNNDVYAGTTPANGDIKVDHPGGAKTGDVFIAIQFATS